MEGFKKYVAEANNKIIPHFSHRPEYISKAELIKTIKFIGKFWQYYGFTEFPYIDLAYQMALKKGDKKMMDRLKENSRYLRVGNVNRTPSGNILSFGTVRKEASDQRATQFYQIFLSWWDSVK